jgi:outer membrane receptor protein involved in Fe transport
LRLRDYTRPDDSYGAQQQAFGAYAMLDWRPVRELRLIAGTRVEAFRQIVVSADPLGAVPSDTPPPSTHRTDIDPMPSIGAVVELIPDMFIRAGYAGTVARPQLRELAPFLFNDFVRRRSVSGNPDLHRTYIHNFDVRWEWFPSASEVLAVSGFVKLFESPIESTIIDDDGDVTFRNIDGAENYGLELEARFHLGHIVPELDWISIGGNFALIYSQAHLSALQRSVATSAQRPLAGQAPYAINVSLGFAPPGTNVSWFAYYNVFGPRLEDVGQNGLPDIYRQPFHSVDLAIQWSPITELTLRLTAQNVLFQRQELQQGDLVVLGINPGTVFSLGVSLSN